MNFDSTLGLVVAITASGMLILWNFATLQRRATFDFKSTCTCLTISRKLPYCLVSAGALLYYVSLLDSDALSFSISPTEISNLYQDEITALSLAPCDTRLSIIIVHRQLSSFDPSVTEETYFLRIYMVSFLGENPQIGEFLHNIQLSEAPSVMDITEDAAYVIVCLRSGKTIKIDCEQGSEMEEGAEMSMNWAGDGILLSSFVKPILSLWSEENRVTAMVKIAPNSFCVGDERGTLNLIETHASGEVKSWEHLYSTHLSNLNLLRVSENKKWLLSYSTVDRSIFAWRIKKKRSQASLKVEQLEHESES
jgi:hypothetical protein